MAQGPKRNNVAPPPAPPPDGPGAPLRQATAAEPWKQAFQFAAPGAACRVKGCGADGYDCGHGHRDMVAQGVLRSTVLPTLHRCALLGTLAAALHHVLSRNENSPLRNLEVVPTLLQGAASLATVVLGRALLSGTALLPSEGSPSAEKAEAARAGGDPKALERILRNRDAYAKHLSQALQCKTVSTDPGEGSSTGSDSSELEKLIALLESTFPLVHRHLSRTIVNRHSLLFEWRGSDESLLPYMVYAHTDVVPVADEDRPKWKVDPWGGVIKDGYIWGRGAIDDKQAVLGQLEAVEDLLQGGFRPHRTVYLAFGHDEEIGGLQGAARIAAELKQRRVRLEFLLDEGLFVLSGAVPGHARPVAMLCVAEKGYVTTRLTVETRPGHASTPPKETAIGILARACAKLEQTPMPAYLDQARAMLEPLASGFAWPMRCVVANLWLFGGLMKAILASKPTSAVLVRTTTALTVFKSGYKENVLPAQATAVVNHRIHPRESVRDVLEFDRRTIADPRVRVEALKSTEPAPVSDRQHPAFQALRDCVWEIFPDVGVTPAVFPAASDSRHFWDLTDQIFRFNPVTLHNSEISMFHGNNERISVENYAQLVYFFRSFHCRCARSA